MGSELVSTDAKNKLEDLSGITILPGQNPYEAFIKACNDNPVKFNLQCKPVKREPPNLMSDNSVGRDPGSLPSSQNEEE